jgi:hypothetical protein
VTPQTPSPDAQPALIRHIVPVIAGGLITLLLTLVTDNTLGAHDVLPSPGRAVSETGPLLLAAGYRALFAILGAHMAARLAPPGQPRIRYALALGIVLLVLSGIGAVSFRGEVPLWYSLSGIALSIPCAIIGGGTAVRVMSRSQATG